MNENDSLNQTNLNEETTNGTTNTQEYQTPDTNTTSNESVKPFKNDSVKHSKFIETLINASDDPEKSRKEWDDITKEFQESKNDFKDMKKDFNKMVDETKANYEKAKPKSLMEKVIRFGVLLFIVAIIVGIFRSCAANTPENRAINTAKDMIFSDYGASNFEIYVDTSLEDVEWDAENLGNDRWAVYMNGYSPEYDIQLMTQMIITDEGDSYSGEIVYVEVDGVGYSDYDNIRYVLAVIYDRVNQEFVSDYMGYLLGF